MQWNSTHTEEAFARVHLDMLKRYPPECLKGAMTWADKNRPTLADNFNRTNKATNQTRIDKDMAGFLVAIKEYENALEQIYEAYMGANNEVHRN